MNIPGRKEEEKGRSLSVSVSLSVERKRDYLSMIPGEGASNQSYQTLPGFFLFTHRFRIASILKLFAKIKNPSARDLIRLVWRREWDYRLAGLGGDPRGRTLQDHIIPRCAWYFCFHPILIKAGFERLF